MEIPIILPVQEASRLETNCRKLVKDSLAQTERLSRLLETVSLEDQEEASSLSGQVLLQLQAERSVVF